MKTFTKMTALSGLLILAGCGGQIESKRLSDVSSTPVQSQPVTLPPISITVTVEGDTINASATGGSNTNHISSGNSSATGGSGGSGGAGGTGGGASAGNSTSTANNSSSSNSTNSSTNSGSASNQANNSTSNSSDNVASVDGSGNSSNTNQNTNTVSAEVDLDLDFDFNIELSGGDDYFKRVKENRKRTPTKCVDAQPGRHMLCHVYDFSGRTQLATQLETAPHLGSFYMDKFDVTARDWQQGFPKFPASLSHLRENYAVRCFTRLRVTQAGSHIFSITSDDGMRVLLNNTPVLQDDGLHAPRTASATTTLVSGLYNLEVQWFQGPRTQIAAELKWATPGNPNLRYIEPSDMQKAKKICQ